jgi:hypothetical protein
VNLDGVKDEREAEGPAPVSVRSYHAASRAEADHEWNFVRKVHSYLSMDASILTPSSTVTHTISKPFSPKASAVTKKVYLHLIQTSGYNTRAAFTHADAAKLKVTSGKTGAEGVTLGEGDGVFIDGGKEGDEVKIESVGGEKAEFVLFEMD